MSDIPAIDDASRPNAGRIYDYLLGGNHNFEIDRQAAQKVVELIPEFPKVLKLIRWFLGEAARRLLQEGFDHFLDFASGLPTADHIHHIAPEGTKVIYSDIDPLTITYSQEIVKDLENVVYVECDATQPERIIHSDAVESLFGTERKVAVGLNGVAYFLPDEGIEHAMTVLYDWAGPGSKVFVCDINPEIVTETSEKAIAYYKDIGQPMFIRNPQALTRLFGSWKLSKPGFLPLAEWMDLNPSVTEKWREDSGTSMVGAFFER